MRTIFVAMTIGLVTMAAHGEPALGKTRVAAGMTVYLDTKDTRLFYYAPGEIQIATDPSGGPDLRFLQIIYTGSEVTGDPGDFVARSVLSFKIVMDKVNSDALKNAKAALGVGARLLPLPIKHMETRLVYTPIVDDAPVADKATEVRDGRLEESDAATATPTYDTALWSERIYTVNPDPYSSQALWEAFHKGQVLISVSYVYFAEGDTEGYSVAKGNPEAIPKELQEMLKAEGEKKVVPILANVVTVRADADKWPDRFKRIDLNQSVPPGYPALDIRCYDFNNSLTPTLALKTVEIKAMGVGGTPVTRTVTFKAATPDIASASLKFPFAVRMDKPFSYRIISVTVEGDRQVGDWKEGPGWAKLLDITSPPPAKPKPADDEGGGD